MPAPAEQTDQSLATCERAHIESVLREYGGNRTNAARVLGIAVRTLQRKLNAWQLTDKMAERASTPSVV